MNTLRFVPPLAALCLLLQGCEIFGSGTEEISDAALTEAGWILLRVEDGNGQRVVSPDERRETYIIEFDADGRGAGVDACNWCSVFYQLGPGDALAIQMGGCTEVACGTESVAYSYFLGHATSYTMRGNRLRIQSTNNEGEAVTLVHQAREKELAGWLTETRYVSAPDE